MSDDPNDDNVTHLPYPFPTGSGFSFTPGSTQVVELGTGMEVDRPDVAATAMEAFDDALGAADIDVVGSKKSWPPDGTKPGTYSPL